MKPLVSIIIPLYNRGHIITRTLESLMDQSHENWECILVDDGSTDNSVQVVEGFTQKDQRFQLHHRPIEKPKGANACRNFGLEMAQGDYINFLDSDDTLHVDKLKLQIDTLSNNDYQFSVCQTQMVDDKSGDFLKLWSTVVSSHKPFDDYVTCSAWWSIHAVLWKNEIISQYRFNEDLHQSQEYELHIRILADSPKFHVLNQTLVTVFVHQNQISTNFTSSIAKLSSNLYVRYLTLKNYSGQLQDETNKYLYKQLFDLFKHFVIHKEVKKALISYHFLVKAAPYNEEMKPNKNEILLRWLFSIPSYFILNKGEGFIKYIR
ncbi:glycosyltransferase [Nonlabens sp. Ci31]|uniref:glycosyltransferase family 2 protein n=1 Tax=Nonlabens sp. Ci31 TaxID=2608253 RepID=UPI001462C567|nr:glycosyltransferase family 2 protein [Nonlabens sp. Ci31]QJP32996.1 glycosyltransferase [Nonlabens sp. Ci31]